MSSEVQSRRDPVARTDVDLLATGGVGETLSHLLGRSIERLEDPGLPPAWVIHEVRKDLKRVRALLRLSRDVLPTRPLEKRCAASARQLSRLRDVDAIGETLARLRARARQRELAAFDEIEAWHAGRRRAVSGAIGLPRQVAGEVAASLGEVRDGLQALSFAGLDAAALDAGLAASRSDSARAFRRAVEKPRPARFHALRKVVKRELYQRELSGRLLEGMEHATLKKLADLLGELQDLEVLRDALGDAGRWQGSVRRLVKRTRSELKARAIRLGGARYPEDAS